MAPRPKKITEIPGCRLGFVAIDEIEEGERFREDYGNMDELVASIQLHGVIQPLAVSAAPADSPKPYILVAGGRRFRACSLAGLTQIPVRIYTEELDEITLRTLELAENVHRKDMSWQEQNALQRRIHLMQQQKYGVPDKGGASKDEDGNVKGWRVDDTASLIGVSAASISESLKLGAMMEQLPQLGWENCKSKSDAQKMAKQVMETKARLELSKRASAKLRAEGSDLHKVISDSYQIGDCVEMMKSYEDGTFHFAEIDPPYAIDLPELKANNDCEGYIEANSITYLIFMKKVLQEAYRVLRDNSFAVLWFGPDPWFEYLYKTACDVGFTATRIPLIWVKPNGQSLSPNTTLANAYEMAFVLKKGSPVLAKAGRTNIFQFSPDSPKEKWHPTQRPLELLKELLATFTFDNTKILVPFAGSGATILASYLTKRSAVGADLSDEFKSHYDAAIPGLFPLVK